MHPVTHDVSHKETDPFYFIAIMFIDKGFKVTFIVRFQVAILDDAKIKFKYPEDL